LSTDRSERLYIKVSFVLAILSIDFSKKVQLCFGKKIRVCLRRQQKQRFQL